MFIVFSRNTSEIVIEYRHINDAECRCRKRELIIIMRYKSRKSFMIKLALSIIALSIVGLVAMFIIVNTIVRTTIYENVIGVAHRDVRTVSLEIDNWFNTSNHIVSNLSRLLPEIGMENIKPISDGLLEEYDFIADIYVGFADGSILGSGAETPGDDWDSTTKIWYIDALAARGELVTTSPYLSALENLGIITSVTKWIPAYNGMEAVVVVSIEMDYIIDMVNQYRLVGGGYLILVDRYGQIVSHPNIEYILGAGGIMNLADIPNGDVLMDHISLEAHIERFEDFRFGTAYIMTFPLESTGWTLAAVVPAVAIYEPVSQYLLVIMLAFAAILVVLFALTMVFVSILTRNMEESKVTEEKLRIIIDNMPLVTNFRDKDFNIIECNEAAAKLFDLSSKEEYLERFFELSPEFQPDGKSSPEKAEAMMKEAFETGHICFEWMHQKLNGEPIPAEVTLTRVEWHDEMSLIAFVRDLRDFYKYKETEKTARQRLQAMLDSSPLACCIMDRNFNIREVNQEAVRLFRLTDGQEYIDKFRLLSPKYQPDGKLSSEKMIEKMDQCFKKKKAHFEWMHQTVDGEVQIPCEVISEYIVLDSIELAIVYIRDLSDITKAVAMVDYLEKAAYTDALTGARNRRYFKDKAEKELKDCIERELPYSLIMIDADHFKHVNDNYGHPVGDEVLKILVARILHNIKKDTMVARYGGEEFVVTLPNVVHDDVYGTAERIRKSVEASVFHIGDLELEVTISVGVASKTDQVTALADIIANADKALYEAKEAGRNTVVFLREKV